MASTQQFRHEDVATVPRGYRVRTVKTGSHQVRVAFPPGPRKKGAGKLVSILHPKAENPKRCNPQAITYLEAAENAVKEGKFDRGKKLLAKGTKRMIADAEKELKRRGLGARGQGLGKTLNPGGKAAKLYTDFHGRAPSEILTMQESLMASGDYTALGDMGSLWIEPVKGEPSDWPAPDIEFEKKDKVKLAADSKGKQLYLVGGNQKLPLDYLEKHGVSTDKRFISLGEVYGISYLTTKSFDGYRDSEYAHEFGEDTGERPFAFYDAELERIVLAGGGYSIARVDDSLGASPGIVN
jgi:hypothetical protein